MIVKMTVKGGKITKITVVSAKEETPKYFNQAKALLKNVIAQQNPEVDAISGATLSSNGLLEAIMDAYNKAKKESTEPDPGADPDPGPGVEPDPGPGGEPDTEVVYQDGTYTGSGWCDDGEEFYYEILVSVRVTDGKITTVSVDKGEDDSDSPEDNDYYLNWAKVGRTFRGVFYPGVPAQIVSSQHANVDTVTGATYSSATIRSIAAQIISEIPTVEKEKPTDPEDPENPDPANPDPVNPDPTTPDPTDPTQGGTTTDPADPADPTQGGTTTDPADPADPTQGGTTTDPADPSDPTQGGTTTDPADPGDPTSGDTSANTAAPGAPEAEGANQDPADPEETGNQGSAPKTGKSDAPDAASKESDAGKTEEEGAAQ